MEDKSYISVVNAHIQSLGVCKEDKIRYHREVHRIMIHAGILDPQSVHEKIQKKKEGKVSRYKPYPNSPWGKYIGKDENRVGKESFMLNEDGVAEVTRILTSHVTDKFMVKTKTSGEKSVIKSAEAYLETIRQSIDGDVLKIWLKDKNVKVNQPKDGYFMFVMNNVRYTYYYNNNVIIWDKKDKNANKAWRPKPFWFMRDNDTMFKGKEDRAKVAMKLISAHWKLKFGNKVETLEWIEEEKGKPVAKPQITQPTITTSTSPSSKSATPTTKKAIIDEIMTFVQPQDEQKRYKDISLEQITKERNPKRRAALQKAYDELLNRRLLTAVNRPKEGWKFSFERNTIELLFRLDDRNSKVYHTRHRKPGAKSKNKERADKGTEFYLPYGLEKLDYKFKTIFVAEGCYDSCFLKNCVAQNCWILSRNMVPVIDIYRNAGFQIIHLPDNFRIGDKGGLNFIHYLVKSKDWLSKGDKVFNWSIYSDCDDLNKIAMTYELDEIDAQVIIANSWGEDEVRENYDKHFTEWLEVLRQKCSKDDWEEFVANLRLSYKVTEDDEPEHAPTDEVKQDVVEPVKNDEPQPKQDDVSCSKDDMDAFMIELEAECFQSITSQASQETKIPTTTEQDDVYEDFLAELEASQQHSIAKAKEREVMKKRYEEHLEEEMWELNRTMKSVFSSKVCV